MLCFKTVNKIKNKVLNVETKNSLLFVVLLFAFLSVNLMAAQLKPFYLASIEQGDHAAIVKATQKKLEAAGFSVIGEHKPYDGTVILVVTNDGLLNNAAATEFGGYGAIQRVAITRVGDDIQVSYTNPVYMSYAYQMAGHLENVEDSLKKALGFKEAFGSNDGLSAEDLQKYHYMFGMPYFTDLITLNKYSTYEEALEKVKTSLAARKGGAYQVYHQDIPGKKQSVFGVGLTKDLSADTQIMGEIDFKEIKSSAHLPYEMLVHADGGVYILSPKFRIAINFTDLDMVGEHSFVGIMNCPVAIRDALIWGSGGEVLATKDDF